MSSVALAYAEAEAERLCLPGVQANEVGWLRFTAGCRCLWATGCPTFITLGPAHDEPSTEPGTQQVLSECVSPSQCGWRDVHKALGSLSYSLYVTFWEKEIFSKNILGDFSGKIKRLFSFQKCPFLPAEIFHFSPRLISVPKHSNLNASL